MSLEKIKKLRDMTGAGVVDIKKALKEADGSETKAIEILRKKGKEKRPRKPSGAPKKAWSSLTSIQMTRSARW